MSRLASEVYASSQGALCSGPAECHYCSAPCKRIWTHDDPVGPFCRVQTSAKRPANPYVCVGCWLFRRKSTTVWYVDGGFKDRQCPEENSWWIQDGHSVGLREGQSQKLFDALLSPPLRFVLSLRSERRNYLHLMQCNDLSEVKANSELAFTVDSIKHTYTVYELEQGLKRGPEGLSPGVGALLRFMGPVLKPWNEPNGAVQEEKRGAGRPKKEDSLIAQTRRVVRKAA